MLFGSVCSGIEAASVAWEPLGWRSAWLAEVEAFPSAVLAHRYPQTPNLGDMTTLPAKVLRGEIEAPNVLVGGTPCQAFSLAGLRDGLADHRGGLTLKFGELANAIDHVCRQRGKPPSIIVWENVPGVLSSKDNAFGCFLGLLAGESVQLEPPGGRWANAGFVLGPQRAIAWRVLDAQYFGVAQRRRRVFVVASARKRFDPRQVLFEFDGMRRDFKPRRPAGKDFAAHVAASSGTSGEQDPLIAARMVGFGDYKVDGTASALKARDYKDATDLIAFVPNGYGNDATADLSPALRVGSGKTGWGESMAVCFDTTQITSPTNRSNPKVDDPCHPLAAHAHAPALATVPLGMSSTVRRLTPKECERLQGFPDDYTNVAFGRPKYPDQICPDGHRFKALGNSMAVPVMRWIGERIAQAVAMFPE